MIDTSLHTEWTSESEAEFAKKVCEVLKPAGVKRLKQAVIQSAGPRALLDRLAIRELQLTAEQEDKLDTLLSPNTQLDLIPNSQVPKLADSRDAKLAAALKVLTAEQRKRWDALVGNAFPAADLLKAHPLSEETMNEQLKWQGGVGGDRAGVADRSASHPPAAEQKKKDRQE